MQELFIYGAIQSDLGATSDDIITFKNNVDIIISFNNYINFAIDIFHVF